MAKKTPTVEGNIFTFPKGARPGTFFHDVLEHLDFTGLTGPSLEDMVEEKLQRYGFEIPDSEH